MGCTYGVAAIARRGYLRAEFSRLPDTEIPEAPSRLSARQWASLIASAAFLLSALLLLLGPLAAAGMLALVFLPPFVVGFQARAVWSRTSAHAEDTMLRAKNRAAQVYYAFLIPTWVIGVVGSYVLAIALLVTM